MTFEQVAKSGSFSSAARQMKKSQSSVNMAMSNLELELNITLFERTPRQVRLTPEGKVLWEYVKTILERCQAFDQRVAAFNQQIESHVSLAIELPYVTIAPVLYEFSITFPEVDIHIKEPFQGDVEAMVRNGEVDMGIALSHSVESDKIQFTQLGKVVMVHVVSADHPLAQRVPVSFADLHNWRHITFGSQEKRIATTEYLSSPMLWRVESYSAMLEAALAGLGWASLPREFVSHELRAGTLVELRQQEYPHTDWIVGVDLLWSKQVKAGKAQIWLRDRLVKHKINEQDNAGNRTTL
ncbi:LysR family transcriptional regulator [Klebsiella pneumoniae]|uniref:LysR family transcriptional regulator n=1 Tax=Klebsiella pneumoniae TaxID=573 RepID=UPI000A3E8562|nr:LysR family transcriptional regulator [Klebsiella pneumoniae]